MSLDIRLVCKETGKELYETNITHNMNTMAAEAKIYDAIWRPEEVCINRAAGVWGDVKEGYGDLMTSPDHYRQFNPPNGWGDYDSFCEWLTDYLRACRRYPDAKVETSR